MKLEKIGNISFLTFSIFENENLKAAVSTRNGGVSKGYFKSLNMKFLDGEESWRVIENRRRFCKSLNISSNDIVACDQVHSSNIRIVTKKDRGRGALSIKDSFHGYDGLITNESDIPLTMCFADCTPVFIYDKVFDVIALCHAGWKGTVGNIVGKAVEIMKNKFGTNPKNIIAGVGPAIGRKAFEVGEEVQKEFLKLFNNKEIALISKYGKKGKYFIDLEKANSLLLIKSGVISENIECADFCTKTHSDVLYSYRKDFGKTGRHMAIFMMKSKREC